MERIGIVGISLHDADVESMERIARPEQGAPGRFLLDLADTVAASEVVVLATCNRVEVIYARESGHFPGRPDLSAIGRQLGLEDDDELQQRLHMWTGRDAARHLFRVASSLDSVVLGEDQILAQVRTAYSTSAERGLCGRLLGPLFEAAFQIGKQVRTCTELSRHPISVASVGLSILQQRLGSERPRIAIVGAGKMSTLAARDAIDRGIHVAVIANRTPENARALAEEVGARALSLEDLARDCEPVDALMSATAARTPVIDAETLRALAARRPTAQPLIAVDLGLPRNIEAIDEAGIEVHDLDGVRATSEANRGLRAAAAGKAEELIEHKLSTYCEQRTRRAFDATLAEVMHESGEVLERELKGLHNGRLNGLDDAQRQAVERWARTAFGRLNHVPISALKRLGTDFHEAARPEGAPHE